MNLCDPARGDPRMLFWNGKPVGAVPGLYIEPAQLDHWDHWVDVSVCVMIAPNTARWLTYQTSSPNGLAKLLEDYRDDPETVLIRIFGWGFLERASKAAPRTLTLADLGEL